MRKDSKKLRYLLELGSHQNINSIDNNEIHKMITELEDIQDMLGSIHDIDITIAHLKKKKHYICDKLKQGTPIRSLLLATGKVDTVYA